MHFFILLGWLPGIAEIKKLGIKQIIISTEKNPVVSTRANKLGIPCLQGINNKQKALIDYSKENYKWETYRFYNTESEVKINNQEEKRYNISFFTQTNYTFNNKNTNIQFGISSNKIKYSWKLLHSVIDPSQYFE